MDLAAFFGSLFGAGDKGPAQIPVVLTDLDQKLELLAATGVDATVVVRFDEAQSKEEPLAFAQRVLVHRRDGCFQALHRQVFRLACLTKSDRKSVV